MGQDESARPRGFWPFCAGEPPNSRLQRAAPRAAAEPERSATCTVSNPSQLAQDAQAGSMRKHGAVLLHACRRKELASESQRLRGLRA